MKITPIKFNIAFCGEKDEDQPLATALKDVFSDKSISNSKQKLLWELSEVPDFYKVSKDMTKDEFVKLADYIKEQDTNILEMALKGDVRIVRKDNELEEEGNPFFTFTSLAKYNMSIQNGTKKGILEFIKEHPIFKIINDALESYRQYNIYPKSIPYELQKDEKGNTIYKPIGSMEATVNAIENTILTGNAFQDKDAVIIFKDKIKGKNDFKYIYTPVSPDKIEKPYSATPENINFLLSLPTLPSNMANTISTLSKIPYFNNLIRSNHPLVLIEFAKINNEYQDIFVKMFQGNIKMGIFEPETKDEFERPIIDIGKLLLDIKERKIPYNNILSALKDDTFAFETSAIYKSFKDTYPNEKIKYIILQKREENLLINISTNSNKRYTMEAKAEASPIIELSKYIDKVPYKAISLNFNEK